MGQLNIQEIQNKTDQTDIMINSAENDTQLLGLSESKLKAQHLSNHFAIKNFQHFHRIGYYQLVDMNRVEEYLIM